MRAKMTATSYQYIPEIQIQEFVVRTSQRTPDMIGSSQLEVSKVSWEIRQGLHAATYGHYEDAVSHFTLARACLSGEPTQLTCALDACIEHATRYGQAQRAFHTACHQFVLADIERQARFSELQALLSVTSDEEAMPDLHQSSSQLVQPAAMPSVLQAFSHGDSALPELVISCFDRFTVWRAGEQIKLCANRNGQTILRYLVVQPHYRATMDVLVDALWPEDPPEIARHKLHVAVSALRRTLNGGYEQHKGCGYLVCENGTYQLNREVSLRIDAEQFVASYQAGQQASGVTMIEQYQAACALYTGPFLSEDMYADWSLIRREQLTQMYWKMCEVLALHCLDQGRSEEAVRWATKILEENRCEETAYCLLMRAYAVAGRRSDAIRQYQRCERTLADELGLQPMPETIALFDAILHCTPLPPMLRIVA